MSKDKHYRRFKMEFKKCGRCGNFYLSNGNVCPKCSIKETYEFSTFKSYLLAEATSLTLTPKNGLVTLPLVLN